MELRFELNMAFRIECDFCEEVEYCSEINDAFLRGWRINDNGKGLPISLCKDCSGSKRNLHKSFKTQAKTLQERKG